MAKFTAQYFMIVCGFISKNVFMIYFPLPKFNTKYLLALLLYVYLGDKFFLKENYLLECSLH